MNPAAFADLSDVLRAGITFRDLLKMKNHKFGTKLLPEDRLRRAKELNDHRKHKRNDQLSKLRRISATVTPKKKKKMSAVEERLARLEQWKQMRQAKKAEEAKNRKPPFRVGCVTSSFASGPHGPVVTQSKSTHNSQASVLGVKEVKQVKSGRASALDVKKEVKQVKSKQGGALGVQKVAKLAKVEKVRDVRKTDGADVKRNVPEKNSTHRYATRSQSRGLVNSTDKGERETDKKAALQEKIKKKRRKSIPKIKVTAGAANKTASPEYPPEPSPVRNNRVILADVIPKRDTPFYISPFVTVSRGKDNARKEYLERLSASAKVEQSRTPQAGAVYFRKVLDDQIEHIENMCKQWEMYKEEQSPPEEACDMINVAIGQSQLLMTKKFKQFRGLIENCATGNTESLVTCEDLHGFWDVVYMQVVNLEERFKNLEKLRENNWEEIVPEKKVVKKAKPARKKVAASHSNMKDIIKAARELKMKQADKVETNTFNGAFFAIVSPRKKNDETVRTPRRSARKSLRETVLSENHRKGSPGLQVLSASINIKQAIAESATSVKSILKPERCFSTEKKSVLFRNSLEAVCGENQENEIKPSTSGKTSSRPKRSSKRLSFCS